MSTNHIRHPLRTFIREAICDLYLKKSHPGTKVIQLTHRTGLELTPRSAWHQSLFFFFLLPISKERLGHRFCFQKASVASFFSLSSLLSFWSILVLRYNFEKYVMNIFAQAHQTTKPRVTCKLWVIYNYLEYLYNILNPTLSFQQSSQRLYQQ